MMASVRLLKVSSILIFIYLLFLLIVEIWGSAMSIDLSN